MDNFKDFIIGAYATSPSLFQYDKDEEIIFMEQIKQELNPIRGLELPFWGDSIHLYDEKLFLTLLDRKWKYVLTCLPGNMKKLESNIHFGLASDDECGRKEAIIFYKKASKKVKQINNYFSSNKVISVVIASSPSLKNKNVSSSMESFEKSLKQLIKFDWSGAKIVLEHCDSGRVKNSIKGFLSIEEEIQAIQSINEEYNTNIGITINWARSTLETRNTNTPKDHIMLLEKLGLLRGLIFSGTSSSSIDYGQWTDLHLPVAKEKSIKYYEESSLLTLKEIKNCLLRCNLNQLDYIGVKVLSMPIKESTMDRRIGLNKDILRILNKAIREI